MLRFAATAALLMLLAGCTIDSAPLEADEAKRQDSALWGAGASIYAPEDYEQYRIALTNAVNALASENARIAPLRNYDSERTAFIIVLEKGRAIESLVSAAKSDMAHRLDGELSLLRSRISSLDKASRLMNEGRLLRKNLIRAEVNLHEAEELIQRESYIEAAEKLERVAEFTEKASEAVASIADRYSDKDQISKWSSWVETAIRESRNKGTYAIVVSKIDRKLVLYKGGKAIRTFDIGLGLNGLKDKLYSGDRATPEGRYTVTKKNPASKFHKALLINYPNDEDIRRFNQARKQGQIPKNTGIGGLIEIHGGGREGITFGCVSLENREMDELYSLVPEGTSVTIVGALDHKNILSVTLERAGK